MPTSPGPQPTAPLVPTITGNPQLDTFIGYVAVHLGAFLAASCVAWMDAHGFDTKSLAATGLSMTVLISGMVSGMVLSGAAWLWGQYRTKWSQKAIVDNTVHAALTNEVPAAIAAKATEQQVKALTDPSTPAMIVEKAPSPPAPST